MLRDLLLGLALWMSSQYALAAEAKLVRVAVFAQIAALPSEMGAPPWKRDFKTEADIPLGQNTSLASDGAFNLTVTPRERGPGVIEIKVETTGTDQKQRPLHSLGKIITRLGQEAQIVSIGDGVKMTFSVRVSEVED